MYRPLLPKSLRPIFKSDSLIAKHAHDCPLMPEDGLSLPNTSLVYSIISYSIYRTPKLWTFTRRGVDDKPIFKE